MALFRSIANFHVKAENAPWLRCVHFYLYDKSGGQLTVAHNPVFEIESGMEPNPTFSLVPEHAQELMDELWSCGFRPSEGTGSAGALKATQNHLDDMRKITFDLLGRK